MHRTILESFSALCWTVATPVAYKALLWAERGEWSRLISIEINPTAYHCSQTYFGDCQVAAFFKKYRDFDLDFDRSAVAKQSFWEAERECYATNERLSPLLEDPAYYGPDVKRFILTWKRIVRRCLGPVPALAFLAGGAFGPGSTFANVGNQILIADKLDSCYTVTERARPYLKYLEDTAWVRHASRNQYVSEVGFRQNSIMRCVSKDAGFAERFFEGVRGNRFTTVEKTAKTNRGICIEASANVFMQLACGKFLSNRLNRYFGWDKRSCQDFHKILARIGSLTGAVATIDLSKASDTVATNLVRLVLPPAWFRLLDDLRSHYTSVDGRWVRLEKFSSMGNGFTFELETLIFRTLIATIEELEGPVKDPYCPGVCYSVFGDDIIVPTERSSTTVASLSFFGFTTNKSKTFLRGPFRESCGGDYHLGKDVRPHYVRKDIELPSELIALANGLRRYRTRASALGVPMENTVKPWRVVLNSLPRAIASCRGPEVLGDLVIHDDEATWSRGVRVRNSVRYLRVWRPVPNRLVGWDHYRPGVQMACALYGVPSGTSPNLLWDGDLSESYRRAGVVPRVNGSYVSGYRFGRVPYS